MHQNRRSRFAGLCLTADEASQGASAAGIFFAFFMMDAALLLTVGSFLLAVELFYLQLTILALLLTIGVFLLVI